MLLHCQNISHCQKYTASDAEEAIRWCLKNIVQNTFHFPVCMLIFQIRRKKHESETIKFFICSLIFETFNNAYFIVGSHRDIIRTLARKINISSITWSFKNIVYLKRKTYLKIYMNNKTMSSNIQQRHHTYGKMRSQEHRNQCTFETI